MITKIILPKLGETMEEGAITKWLKKEGEKIGKGEPVFEVTTDKAAFEVESPASGVIRKILLQADADKQIPVIRTIGYIADSMDEEIPEEAVGWQQSAVSEEGKSESIKKQTASELQNFRTSERDSDIIKVSPLAKKLAGEKGIDLAQVKGTGPNGRITEKDILNYVSRPSLSAGSHAGTVGGTRIKASPRAKKIAGEKGINLSQIKGTGPGGRILERDVISVPQLDSQSGTKIIPLSGIRKIIAKRLTQSKHDAPHYYLQIEINMAEAVKLREKKNKSFSYNDMIIKSVAKSLEKFPMLNAAFREEKITVYNDINIGIAVASPEGLVVPVIKNANKLKIEQIAEISKKIKNKSDTNKFSPEDFSSGTFTISNLGMYGIDVFTAIINPPQVGILAVGAIKEKPVVLGGKVGVCPIMKMSLSSDHRVIDGAYAAGFLGHLKEILQKPCPVFAERRQERNNYEL